MTTKAEKQHMDRVASLPCACCGAEGDTAQQAIKALAEHHRRSLGQIVRWQFFAMQREGIIGNDQRS